MKQTYYLFNPGILSRKDNTLKFTPVEQDEKGVEHQKQPRYIPVETVSDLYVFGALTANSALYNFLGKNGIAVHFFDHYENYTGSFMPKDSQLSGRMLLAQTSCHQKKKDRLQIAQKFVDGCTYNLIKNLSYYNRRGKDLDVLISRIEVLSEQIETTTDVNQLMGIEGNIHTYYYEAFELIINDFMMEQRSRRPPQNEVNALLSFGNMVCYSECLRAIHQTQLNPTISYLHSPGERRYSLALDISEIFKPLLVDRTIFKVLNKKEIQEKHFDRSMEGCMLNEAGKKIFVKALEERLNETIKHRSLGRNVSYRHLIKLECYKLAKHIMQIEEYKPFKMYW